MLGVPCRGNETRCYDLRGCVLCGGLWWCVRGYESEVMLETQGRFQDETIREGRALGAQGGDAQDQDAMHTPTCAISRFACSSNVPSTD